MKRTGPILILSKLTGNINSKIPVLIHQIGMV